MSNWNRNGPVVVEVDGTAENLRVVDYASAEAMRVGVELVLVATSSPVAENGSRLRVLAHAARSARMLVVGRPRSRGPQRLVHAQANLRLAARAGCPMVVVPLSWRPSLLDRKVAVGVDGTALSAEALEFAFGIAAGRDGDLVVVHAGLPAERPFADEDPECSWISRADYLVSETLAPWTSRFPEVKVTRFLSSRAPSAALVHESSGVGLVVVGSHSGPLAIDPVARRSVAAMTCPVAIVPHHLTDAEHTADRRTESLMQG